MYTKEKQRQLFKQSKQLLKAENANNELLAAAQVEELREVITYHEWKYAVLNDPVISDFEYDTLYKKLEALESNFPSLLTQDLSLIHI